MEQTRSWEPSLPGRSPEPRRFFAETGHAVSGPFLEFLEHYGLTVCGFPISDVIVEDGLSCQYFQHLALLRTEQGAVRVKPLGEAWLAHVQELGRAERAEQGPRAREVDVVASLARHPSRSYDIRTLADIRYVVIHHTGGDRDLDVRSIATEHVGVNGWPGIGYHFVVGPDGTVYKTQDLTTISYHARQFNPVAVGVAVVGDLAETLPTTAQLGSVAELLADLLASLGLPVDAVRGHREMVPTPCPGETFLSIWKPRVIREVERRLNGTAVAEQSLVAEGSGVAVDATATLRAAAGVDPVDVTEQTAPADPDPVDAVVDQSAPIEPEPVDAVVDQPTPADPEPVDATDQAAPTEPDGEADPADSGVPTDVPSVADPTERAAEPPGS